MKFCTWLKHWADHGLQCLRDVFKVRVALVHADMAKSRIQDVVWCFQGDAHLLPEEWKNEPRPQYIVANTKLICVGYNMQAARRCVQIEPEWLLRDENQVKCRANRIGQKLQTFSYGFLCVDSHVEQLIHNRQRRRNILLRLAMNPENCSENTVRLDDDGEVQDDETQILEKNGDLIIPPDDV